MPTSASAERKAAKGAALMSPSACEGTRPRAQWRGVLEARCECRDSPSAVSVGKASEGRDCLMRVAEALLVVGSTHDAFEEGELFAALPTFEVWVRDEIRQTRAIRRLFCLPASFTPKQRKRVEAEPSTLAVETTHSGPIHPSVSDHLPQNTRTNFRPRTI